MEEVGMEKLDNMMKALEEAEDMEQLVEIENNIAFELGEGFLKGKYDWRKRPHLPLRHSYKHLQLSEWRLRHH